MRVLALVLVAGFPAEALSQSADDLPRSVGRRYVATGKFTGSVTGENVERKYNGDTVTEKIDCRIDMTFNDDGTVSYTTRDYLYEKVYQHKTTTGGYEVGRTRLEAVGGSGTRGATLTVTATQYGNVWAADWNPKVDQPGQQQEDAWLEDGQGRVWGHSSKPATVGTVFCEPRVFWRGSNGRGPGRPLQGSYHGPHHFWRWAKVDAVWNFTLPAPRQPGQP